MIFALLNYFCPDSFLTLAPLRLVLAAITALMFVIFFGPRFINKLYELKTGQTIRVEDCPMLAKLHEKKRDTPTMGGILIICAMLFAMLLWMDWSVVFTPILLLTTLWFAAIGGYDDYLKMRYKNSNGMRAKKKFLLQAIFALVLAAYLLVPAVTSMVSVGDFFSAPVIAGGAVPLNEFAVSYYIPFLKTPIHLAIFLVVLVIIFIVTGSTNAVNLTDGLDGLAPGCLILTSGVLGFFAFISGEAGLANYFDVMLVGGSQEIAIYLFTLSGACLGFLWYNGYPAQVFMGDIGALSLGAVLGVSAILIRRELLLGLVGGIFVMEALSVILQVGSYKLRNRKRIFLCAPLHHHFECKGWPETKVVMRFWIIAALLAILGLLTLKTW